MQNPNQMCNIKRAQHITKCCETAQGRQISKNSPVAKQHPEQNKQQLGWHLTGQVSLSAVEKKVGDRCLTGQGLPFFSVFKLLTFCFLLMDQADFYSRWASITLQAFISQPAF